MITPIDPKPAIRQQLAHMLESRVFVQSEKLSQFLRFAVEHVLEGNRTHLKEYVIGSEVYDRKPPYHPSHDSIVRTEARRLRNKLKEYYETDGKEDAIYVYLRPGSYIPVFHCKAAMPNAPALREGIAVAILPFCDISECPLSARYTRGIPDELAHILIRTEGCKVISHSCGWQFAFEGSVRQEGGCIRVTARIVDAGGSYVWATRVDVEAGSDSMFMLEEQIASRLSVGFRVLSATVPRLDDIRLAAPLSLESLVL